MQLLPKVIQIVLRKVSKAEQKSKEGKASLFVI